MASDIAFAPVAGVDLRRALVVIGTPTVGFVGDIVARHLVSTLEMRDAGGFSSTAFPPFFPVDAGLVRPAVRVHALDAACGAGVACSRLVVVTCDFGLGPRLARAMTDAMLAFLRATEARLVVIPDGVPRVEGGVPDVFGVASSGVGLSLLRALAIEPLGSGVVGGFTGMLLDAASATDLPVVAILSEADPTMPDARAASRLVGAMRGLVPDLDLAPEELVEESERIEAEIRALRAEIDAQPTGEPAAPPMFR